MSTNATSFTVEASTKAFTDVKPTQNGSSDEISCGDTMLSYDLYMLALFLAAVVMFIILSSTEKRKGQSRERCNGRCGILLSVNFLENVTNRSMIIAAFVLTTLDVVTTLYDLDDTNGIPSFVIFIFRIMMVCVLSFAYLPLFHCISANTFLRHCLGLCHVLVILPLMTYTSTTVCHYTDLTYYLIASHITKYLIIASAGGFLVFKFIYRLAIKPKRMHTSQAIREAKDPHQVQYIKDLLRKKQDLLCENEVQTDGGSYRQKIRRVLYRNKPGFRFSITILTSVILGLLLYILVISAVVGFVIDLYNVCWDLINVFRNAGLLSAEIPNVVVELAKLFTHHGKNSTVHAKKMTIAKFLETQLNCLYVCFFLAASLAALQVCSTVVFMLKGYRRNVLSMYRQSFPDDVLEGTDNATLVVCAIQFAGYQVAHMIWGYILQLVVFFLLILIFTEVIVFPILFNYWGVIGALAAWLGPILVTMFGSRYLQMYLVKNVFLINNGRVFGIDNRKCFFNMMFFMFFYNIFIGLISCFSRVIKVTILGVWFFPRLDMSVFPHSFEKFDAGYKAYVCLLKLEERQNNIILLAFVHMMIEKCCATSESKNIDLQEQGRSAALNAVRKKVPRNRWFLAWTLIHNKSLQNERRWPAIYTSQLEPISLPSSDLYPPINSASQA